MKRLKGLRNIFVLLVIMGLILSGCTTGGSKQTETADTAVKPVKVGWMTPMSGAAAAYGKNTDIAVRIALEDFNKDAKVKIELQAEDAGSTPVTAKNGLDKLLESNPLSVLLFTLSSQFNGISATLEAKKIPTALCSSLPSIYQHGWEWMFGYAPTGDLQVTAGVRYLNEKLGKRKIGVIISNDDLGKTVLATLIKDSGLNNYTIMPEFYQSGENDYTASITNVRKQKPEAYFVYGVVGDTAKILRQMKQLGVQEPTFNNNAAIRSFLNLMEANEVEGLYGIGDIPLELSTDPKVLDFAKRFKEKAGFDADAYSLYAYDGAMLLFNASSKSGGDPKKVNENMRATQGYKGFSGTFNFDSQGRGRHDTSIIQVGPNKTLKITDNYSVNN